MPSRGKGTGSRRAVQQLRHRYLLPPASRIPGGLLVRLHRLWPVDYDPSDGWSFWFDASYHAYVRRDKRARKAGRS